MPAIRCVIMRGGTSKAVFLKEADVPSEPGARLRTILAIFGSPDARQIDGLGGADPLTSKVAIIGPPRANNARAAATHLTYTFGQVAIDAAGRRLPEPVRQHQLGGRRICHRREPRRTDRARDDRPRLQHQPRPGPDAGSPGCRRPSGGTRRLLGAGRSGYRRENPGRFVRYGRRGNRSAAAHRPAARPPRCAGRRHHRGVARGHRQCARLRAGARRRFGRHRDRGGRSTPTTSSGNGSSGFAARPAGRMGMISDPARSRVESPATPILGIVSPPADYLNDLTHATVRAAETDVLSRLMFMQQAHKTYAGTSTVCTGVASRIPGTVVHEMTRPETLDRGVVPDRSPRGRDRDRNLRRDRRRRPRRAPGHARPDGAAHSGGLRVRARSP